MLGREDEVRLCQCMAARSVLGQDEVGRARGEFAASIRQTPASKADLIFIRLPTPLGEAEGSRQSVFARGLGDASHSSQRFHMSRRPSCLHCFCAWRPCEVCSHVSSFRKQSQPVPTLAIHLRFPRHIRMCVNSIAPQARHAVVEPKKLPAGRKRFVAEEGQEATKRLGCSQRFLATSWPYLIWYDLTTDKLHLSNVANHVY